MKDKPLARIDVNDWKGQQSDPSPFNVEPGATQSQVNLLSICDGILEVRPGVVPVTFANAITASSAEVVAMYRYSRPEADFVVYELSDGVVKSGRNPS